MATVLAKEDWIPFFESAGFSPPETNHFAALFFEHQIGADLLPDLTTDYLKAMGINTVGYMIRILKRAKEGWRLDSVGGPDLNLAYFAPEETASTSGSSSAEQKTVLVKMEAIVEAVQTDIPHAVIEPLHFGAGGASTDVEQLSIARSDDPHFMLNSAPAVACNDLAPENVRSVKTQHSDDLGGNADELDESGLGQCMQLPDVAPGNVKAASDGSVQAARRKSSRLECSKAGKSWSINNPLESGAGGPSSMVTQPRDLGNNRTAHMMRSSDQRTSTDGELRALPIGGLPASAVKNRKRASGQVLSRDTAERKEVRSKRAKVASKPSATHSYSPVKCEPIRDEELSVAINDPREEFNEDFELAELDDHLREDTPTQSIDYLLATDAMEIKVNCERSKGSLSRKSKARLAVSRRLLRVQRKPVKRHGRSAGFSRIRKSSSKPAKGANSSKRKPSFCGACKEPVGRPAIKCCLCRQWHHSSCAHLTDKELVAHEGRDWTCVACATAEKDINEQRSNSSSVAKIDIAEVVEFRDSPPADCANFSESSEASEASESSINKKRRAAISPLRNTSFDRTHSFRRNGSAKAEQPVGQNLGAPVDSSLATSSESVRNKSALKEISKGQQASTAPLRGRAFTAAKGAPPDLSKPYYVQILRHSLLERVERYMARGQLNVLAWIGSPFPDVPSAVIGTPYFLEPVYKSSGAAATSSSLRKVRPKNAARPLPNKSRVVSKSSVTDGCESNDDEPLASAIGKKWRNNAKAYVRDSTKRAQSIYRLGKGLTGKILPRLDYYSLPYAVLLERPNGEIKPYGDEQMCKAILDRSRTWLNDVNAKFRSGKVDVRALPEPMRS